MSPFVNSPFLSSGLPDLSQNQSLCKTFHTKMSLICMKMSMQVKHICSVVLTQRQTLNQSSEMGYLQSSLYSVKTSIRNKLENKIMKQWMIIF